MFSTAVCIMYIVSLFTALSKQQTISLRPYDSSERIYQSGVERVVYISYLQDMDSVQSRSVVKFEKKTSSNDSFRNICYMQLKICELETGEPCRCVFNSSLDHYELTVNISAEAIYSRGRIRVTLMYNGLQSSREVFLPAIYDVPQIEPGSSNLYINDRKISDTHCFVETDYDVATIVFSYTSPSISLEIKEGNTTLKNGTSMVVYTMRTWTMKTLTLCHKDLLSNLLLKERICTIQKTSPEIHFKHENNNSSLPIVVTILCLVQMILLGIIIFALKNNIVRQIKSCKHTKKTRKQLEMSYHYKAPSKDLFLNKYSSYQQCGVSKEHTITINNTSKRNTF